MIKLEGVSKSYGAIKAVQKLSFEADDGQITTLLGANGSGKTTTFNAIAGLTQADEGRVTIDGENESNLRKALLSFFPDTFGLYEKLTTREHLAYFGGLHGLRGTALDDAIAQTIIDLDMADIADRRTQGFSQGQRMKVALGRALVHDPQNLVLDEPMRGLDVMSIRLLRSLLIELRNRGKCILLSSHVMAEVSVLSDHLVVISGGVKCHDGTEQTLIESTDEDNLEDAFVTLAHPEEQAK